MKYFPTLAVVALALTVPLAVDAADPPSAFHEATASRVDSSRVRPMLVFDRAWIEASGKFSVAELLRDLTLNTAGAPRAIDEFLEQPVYAGVDLRGLGSDATLVLVDGRRAPSAPLLGQATDLLSLPLAMIERIEIYPDGAGAVHGADAAAGVVNLVTRADFDGAEFSAGRSESPSRGGEIEQASALFGIEGKSGRVTVGAAYDRRFGRSVGQPGPFTSRPTPFGNNFTGPMGSALPPGVPTANRAGCEAPGYVLRNDRCLFEDLDSQVRDMDTRNESLFGRAHLEVSEHWSVFLNGRVSRTRLFSRFAPDRAAGLELAPGSPNHPAAPPSAGGLNPRWQDYSAAVDLPLGLQHTFAANGPLDRRETTENYAVDLAMMGRIGTLDLEFGLGSRESNLTALGRNSLVATLVQARLDDGAYNLYDPFATPDDVLGSMGATASIDANWEERLAWATARRSLLALPAGSLNAAFGFEYRDEQMRVRPDDLSAAGLINSILPDTSAARGDRETFSLFAEADVPILDSLGVNLAARWDDSDDLGSIFNARAALAWKPLEWLEARASWSRSGLSAPVTQNLQFPASLFDNAINSSDDAVCQRLGFEQAPCFVVPTGRRILNPDLEHASTTQQGIGITLRPLSGLSFSADAFDIELEDRFAFVSPTSVVLCWLAEGANPGCPDRIATLPADGFGPGDGIGVSVQPGLPPLGSAVFAQYGLVNAGSIDLRGIDFRLQGGWDSQRVRLDTEILATWTERYRFNGSGNAIGASGLPEWRGQWVNRAQYGPFSLAWFLNWIGPQSEAFSVSGDGWPSWVTHDVQLAWATPWSGRIVLGVDNLTDREPVRIFPDAEDHETRLYDNYGRLGYLRYVQRF